MFQNDNNPKRTEALSFLNSSKFGLDTWTTIFNFDLNAHNIISTIEIYSTLIDEMDKGNLLTTNDRQSIIRIQQHIVLDTILKIQILIESTLVLVHSLSIGYHTVAKNMTYYDYNLLDTVIAEIRKNKKLKNYKYNLRKVLGLPNLKYLSLSTDEKKLLNEDFQNFELNCLDTLKNLISFYDKFDIVYGKSKHGLAYITGGSADPINKGKRIFDNSVLSCYSRINKKHTMPKETIASSTFSSSPPMQYRYFNFISIINFSTNLVEEINSILSRLNELISFVCKNHELYALNCGKVYLPCNKRENKLIMMNLRKPQLYTENDQKILKNIAEKNLPKIYFPSLETIFNIRYTNPKVIQSITDNSITNILIP